MSEEIRDDLPESIENLYDAGSSEDGAINIAENVFASIIENYTLEIPEVVRFTSSSVVGSLAKIIGKSSSNDPIVVDIENDQLEVTVNVILQFGCHVPSIAAQIQEVVNKNVEAITGKRVIRVNVNVIDLVHNNEEDEKGEE